MLSPIRLTQTALVLLAVALVGCSGLPGPFPAPGAALAIASPTGPSTPPMATTPSAILQMSTPQPDAGAVKGKLVYENTGQPYLATLYLGRAIPASQPGYPPMISFSDQTDPKATQDPSTGVFDFRGVAPGTYALILWSPVGNKIVEKPGSKESVLVEVRAGETSDLGTIPIR